MAFSVSSESGNEVAQSSKQQQEDTGTTGLSTDSALHYNVEHQLMQCIEHIVDNIANNCLSSLD